MAAHLSALHRELIALHRLKWVQWLALAVVVISGAMFLRYEVLKGFTQPPSPLSYSQWKPARQVYEPGQEVVFSYVRTLAGREYLVREYEDAWVPVSNDEPGLPAGRLKSWIAPGRAVLTSKRRLPWDLPPGVYRLVGVAEVRPARPVRPVYYESEPITVVKRADPTKP